jgi:FKBP12-rapamycin complex-associated protein
MQVTSIKRVESQLHVISSKQRPRKCTMLGNDGRTYQYLLKGHEDLRQDER